MEEKSQKGSQVEGCDSIEESAAAVKERKEDNSKRHIKFHTNIGPFLRVRTRSPESAQSQARECALADPRVRTHFSSPTPLSALLFIYDL